MKIGNVVINRTCDYSFDIKTDPYKNKIICMKEMLRFMWLVYGFIRIWFLPMGEK